MDIVLNIIGALCSLTLIGLIVTNPRTINKTYRGISEGINGWFEKAFSSTSERFEDQGALEPEPIDYEKLEADNKKSMVIDWSRRYLELLKPEEMTKEEFTLARKLGVIDLETYLRGLADRSIKDSKHDPLDEDFMPPPRLAKADDEGWLCNPCARSMHRRCTGYGVAGVRHPCSCGCWVDRWARNPNGY